MAILFTTFGAFSIVLLLISPVILQHSHITATTNKSSRNLHYRNNGDGQLGAAGSSGAKLAARKETGSNASDEAQFQPPSDKKPPLLVTDSSLPAVRRNRRRRLKAQQVGGDELDDLGFAYYIWTTSYPEDEANDNNDDDNDDDDDDADDDDERTVESIKAPQAVGATVRQLPSNRKYTTEQRISALVGPDESSGSREMLSDREEASLSSFANHLLSAASANDTTAADNNNNNNNKTHNEEIRRTGSANSTARDSPQSNKTTITKQSTRLFTASLASSLRRRPVGGSLQPSSRDSGILEVGVSGGGANGRAIDTPKPMPYCVGVKDKEPAASWHCSGFRMKSVPENLIPKPTSLRFSNVGLERLERTSLEAYATTLRDFSMEHAPLLANIERNVFANLTRLRVVYIFQAPRLNSFDLAIVGRHPDLTTIRIQQTGLKTWPNLSEFVQERILTSIDLDNNRIETLGSRPINIRAELLNLEFNLITSIDEHTFNGSEIGTLSLSGNRQLTSIHRNAFANLKNLIKLDLSSTSVTQLPSVGLHQLRFLTVRDNYALRQVPSIYVFPMLEEAHMTYSHHCCSFRYPKTHDPSAYEEHIRLQNEINSVCASKRGGDGAHEDIRRDLNNQQQASISSTPLPTTSSTSAAGDFEGSFFDMSQLPVQQTGFEGAASSSESPVAAASSTTMASAAAQKPEVTSSSTGINETKSGQRSTSLKKQWLLQNIECGELVLKSSDQQNITCTPEPDAFNPCEDIMGYPVLRVAVWFVVACSMLGNMSVIVVLLGIYRRLSVPKFLQLNLAIGDLFMGVYLAMLAGADLITLGTYFNYVADWQHGLGCQLAGAASLFASQLSIFTLIVITFERYYTITYSIDLNMRLQLGWATRIMLVGWLFAFASAMLPIWADINSYSKTSICLPMRTESLADRAFIIILLVIDSCAFLIIFICYLRMYLLILKQKTEASLKERTVAMRMALLVLTDFACWAPIIFFGATAIVGVPLIDVTKSKILVVFFYPLNSMANPYLYVLSTRQYKRDLNYVLSRLEHWRKNLFKSQEDKDYSFNAMTNVAPPYGLVTKYASPAALNVHLGAVAAVTGVANHLHHYKLNYLEQELQTGSDQQEERNNGHHHHHHHHHHRLDIHIRDKQHLIYGGQRIIRHQILPGGVRQSAMTKRAAPAKLNAARDENNNNQKQQNVKMGQLINEDEAQVSELIDSGEFFVPAPNRQNMEASMFVHNSKSDSPTSGPAPPKPALKCSHRKRCRKCCSNQPKSSTSGEQASDQLLAVDARKHLHRHRSCKHHIKQTADNNNAINKRTRKSEQCNNCTCCAPSTTAQANNRELRRQRNRKCSDPIASTTTTTTTATTTTSEVEPQKASTTSTGSCEDLPRESRGATSGLPNTQRKSSVVCLCSIENVARDRKCNRRHHAHHHHHHHHHHHRRAHQHQDRKLTSAPPADLTKQHHHHCNQCDESAARRRKVKYADEFPVAPKGRGQGFREEASKPIILMADTKSDSN